MKTLVWKLNRLHAMGTAEICDRGTQWLIQSWERLQLSRGGSPEPPSGVRPSLSLLPVVDGWLEWWTAHYRLDRESLRGLMAGKIPFFGHGVLDAGNPVDWHRDPLTGVRAPMHYGKAINYRDPLLVGDIKVLWELGRHQHLVPLATAYACTGESEYRASVGTQIGAWVRANPYGRGVHWCSALEVALRLISWAFCHSLLTLRDGAEGLFGCVPERDRI
ncbi:MAG: heparinase II/III family protein, partial [Acidiferrobacteraceae bacterium]